MDKNLRNTLRLAGLLTEQDDQAPDMSTPDGSPADQGGGDDPAALLDQAIELLNKVKSSLGSGGASGGAEAGGPPPGGPAPGGAAPGI